MKAICVVAASAAASLAWPAAATAKEPVSATFCGISACRTVTDRDTLNSIPAGETVTPLGRAAPYYRIEIVTREPGHGPHSFFLYYIPSANGVAWAENGIVRLHPIFGSETTSLMRRLVSRLEPFPGPKLTGARVGTRTLGADVAQSYVRLFEERRTAALAESPDDWTPIDLHSVVGSPWTDGTPDLVYSPSANVLERGWDRVELPESLADDVEAVRPLDASGGDGLPWPTIALSLLGAMALAGLRLR